MRDNYASVVGVLVFSVLGEMASMVIRGQSGNPDNPRKLWKLAEGFARRGPVWVVPV